jgi:hypothetical protein
MLDAGTGRPLLSSATQDGLLAAALATHEPDASAASRARIASSLRTSVSGL